MSVIDNITSNLPVIIKDCMTSDQIGKIETVDSKNFSIDSIIAAFNIIPVVGGFIANELSNAKVLFQSYKEDDFFRKFLYLIYNIRDTSEKERESFMSEVEEKANDYSGSVIAGLIDRIDNINKAVIIANLIKARIEDYIDIEDFFRLSNVVERIPYTDFKYLKDFEKDLYIKGGITEMLYSTGVLLQTLISGDANEGNLYCLSDLGEKIVVYGLHVQLNIEKSYGTSLPIASRDDIREILKQEHVVTHQIDDDGPCNDK